MTDSFLIDLRLGAERVTLLAEPDPDRRQRALVHGAGFALSHLDLELPPALRAVVLEVARRFAEAPAGDPLGLLAALAPEVEPLASAVLRRRILDGQRAPAFPPALRRGRPTPGSLWPFDAESTALELGLRQVIYREGETDATYLESRGFAVKLTPGGVIAARDRAVLQEAALVLAASRTVRSDWAEHARRAGQLLGYPECCTQAFVACRRRDDVTLFAMCLPPPAAPASPLECLFLNTALAVISHLPCCPDCDATAAIGARVLAALEGQCPGFCALHSRLGHRLHALDRQGRAFAFEVDEGLVVKNALEVQAPALVERPDIRQLRVDRARGVLLGDGFESSLFARY